MAYIGLQPQQRTVATSTQTLSGNGVDFEFSLNRAVSKAADVLVFVGSTVQVPELDYTAYDNTLLFSTAPTSGTNNISVNYKAGALSTTYISANSYPVGSTVSPSIRSADAASTGIYFPTTTSLGITVSGNTRLTVTDSPTASSTSTGAVRVVGGMGVTQKLYVGGATNIVDTTQSTNSTSGALIVAGGAGIAKDVFIAGQLSVAGDFTVAGQFTTTGSDSLAVNDPFVFLANANPGDNLDSGFVSSYFDGSNTRYTGIFRDITDSKYKLFKNLLVQPTTTVDTGNVSFQYADFVVGNLTATTITGTVDGANITTVGNLTSLSVAGTVSSWGINYLYSTQAASSTTTGALQVKGGAGVVGSLYAGAFYTAGALNVNSGNGATAIVNSGTSGVGNVGASGAAFNTVFAKSTSAQYADVAENYLADAAYEPGTVLHFGGEYEVSQCNIDACTRVAGVVSTNPAYIMNDTLAGEHVATVALLGRVPCKVVGPVQRGDMMVSAGNGRARSDANPKLGSVIGKALEDFNGAAGVIEVVVGRN